MPTSARRKSCSWPPWTPPERCSSTSWSRRRSPPKVSTVCRALCESFLSYVEQRTLPGGCFFAAAAAELGGRSGPVRQRVADNQKQWMGLLTAAAEDAVAHNQLRHDVDIALLVFELNALVVAANSSFILHGDRAVIDRARTAVARALIAGAPAT